MLQEFQKYFFFFVGNREFCPPRSAPPFPAAGIACPLSLRSAARAHEKTPLRRDAAKGLLAFAQDTPRENRVQETASTVKGTQISCSS